MGSSSDSPKVVHRDFRYDSRNGWYLMLQLSWNGELWFLCQQLPEKVTAGWIKPKEE